MYIDYIYTQFADSKVYVRKTKRCWSHLITFSHSNATGYILCIVSGASFCRSAVLVTLSVEGPNLQGKHKSKECFANDGLDAWPHGYNEATVFQRGHLNMTFEHQ